MTANPPPPPRYQLIGLWLLALLVPTLIGYTFYNQWRTPIIDLIVDSHTGAILTVEQDSYGNYAGFMPGDVLGSINDQPWAEATQLSPGLYPATILRNGELLTLELPIVPLLRVNGLALASATITTLLYWSIGGLLLLRRSQLPAVRLLYTLSQTFAVLILFPLAYPLGTLTPIWALELSYAAFFISAPMLIHFYLLFPIPLGTARNRQQGCVVLYGLAMLSLLCWLAGSPTLHRLAAGYVSLEVLGALGLLLYSYTRQVTPNDRRRVRLIFFGNLAAGGPALCGYVLPQLFNGSYYLPEWLVALFLALAPLSYLHAVIRQQLFDIDRFLNRSLVYALLSLGIFLIYLGPFLLLYRLVPGDLLAQTLVGTWLTLLLGLAFNWARERIQRRVDQLFYGGWYDYPQVVEAVSDALARTLERAQLNDVLTRQVPALMQLEAGTLAIEADAPCIAGARQIVHRLHFREQVQGCWVVGPRRDGDEIPSADQRILETVARQAEIALGNVLLVETLRRQLEEIRAHQAALAHTQRQLLRSREAERARLARELHDGPLQTLVGLRLQIELLRAMPAAPPALPEISMEIKMLLGELRQVCAALRPPLLDTLGLSAALVTLAEEWREQYHIPVHIWVGPAVSSTTLPDEVAVNLYRIAQEGLANIARHAHASQVTLRLEQDGDMLRLTLTDDGQGFPMPENLNALAAAGHFGLLGMRERVELIGGQLKLQTRPGAGTSITISCPAATITSPS